jgi:hypothetical protein
MKGRWLIFSYPNTLLSIMEAQVELANTMERPKPSWFAKRSDNEKKQVTFGRAAVKGQEEAKKFDTSDRTKQVMRFIYPINSSGTKQIVMGADPEFDFKPSVTIRRPGGMGIKMSPRASSNFIAFLPTLKEYFETEGMPDLEQQIFTLSPGETIEFGEFLKKKCVTIKKELSSNKFIRVVLTSNTIFFMNDLYHLLMHVFDGLAVQAEELMLMHGAMRKKLNEDSTKKSRLRIRSLTPEELEFQPNPSITMDHYRAFMEIRKYCENELCV